MIVSTSANEEHPSLIGRGVRFLCIDTETLGRFLDQSNNEKQYHGADGTASDFIKHW